jgi:3-oxoacyl-[acyl-carrier-protein] synthase-1
VGDAVQRILAGAEDMVVVGAVDSYLDARTIAWLEGDRRLAHARSRGGLAPGEAATFLMIASEDACTRTGIAPAASVLATACAQELRDSRLNKDRWARP